MNTQTITATVKELEALTGYNQATLSILLRLAKDNGSARIVGSVAKPDDVTVDGKVIKARGKPASIWEVEPFTVDLTEAIAFGRAKLTQRKVDGYSPA